MKVKNRLQAFAGLIIQDIQQTIKDRSHIDPAAKEALLKRIDDHIKSTSHEASKFLGCLIYAYAATVLKSAELPKDFRKNLEIIASEGIQGRDIETPNPFSAVLPEEEFSPPHDRPAGTFFFVRGELLRDYDQSLLYLAACAIFNEKYGADGIYLGNVAALVIPDSHNRETQKLLVDILGEHHINPFKNETILEIGGHSIKHQPLAKLFKACDTFDVLSRGAPRADYLLLETQQKHFTEKKYKFVISSRVLEQDSEISRINKRDDWGRKTEPDEKLIYDCFAAMANLTQKGGYAIHRTLASEKLFADQGFHELTGMHGSLDELSIMNLDNLEIPTSRDYAKTCVHRKAGMQIHIYHKYADKTVAPQDFQQWYDATHKRSVVQPMRQ